MQGIELFPPEAQELILTSAINYQRYAGLLLSAERIATGILVHVKVLATSWATKLDSSGSEVDYVKSPGTLLTNPEIIERLEQVFKGHDVTFNILREDEPKHAHA